MDRRKFIKSSMYLGCGAALLPASQSQLLPEISYKFSDDKFIYKRKEDLPNFISLEACSLCQLNCPACSMRTNEKNLKKKNVYGYLKFDNFKSLIDDNPQIKNMDLSHKGEIFLNPELDKIIEYAYKKGIGLVAYAGVNLNHITDEIAELIVRCKFKMMNVSIDGATPETYKIYRVGGDFNRVIENIQKINKYKKLYNSEFPKLYYKFIVFGHNEHEIELAKQKAKNLNMIIRFDRNNIPSYSPIKNKKQVAKQTGFDLNESQEKFNIKRFDLVCIQLFERPQINFNGDLVGCCCAMENAAYNNIETPNVFEVGLMNALNSDIIIESKHMVTNLLYKPSKNNPCINCFYYNNVLKRENICVEKYA